MQRLQEQVRGLRPNDRLKQAAHWLESAFQHQDTVQATYFQLYDADRAVSRQLRQGNARVWYNREHRFVDTIVHWLERYGSIASRFFYLPDNRPFFSDLEITGIWTIKASMAGGTIMTNLESRARSWRNLKRNE